MQTFHRLAIIGAFGFFSIQTIQAQVKIKPGKPLLQKRNFVGCGTEDPVNSFALDTIKPTRGLVDNNFLWDNGKALTVKFISGGSPILREKIKKAAKEWEKYANLSLDFVDNGEANIRVLLTDKGGCNSVVGTVALQINPEEKKNEH